MKRRSSLFIPNIVLTIVFFIFLFLSALVIFIFHFAYKEVEAEARMQPGFSESYLDEDVYSYYENLNFYKLELGDIRLEKIGEVYKDGRRKGYQFYRVTAEIKNSGTQYAVADYLGWYFHGPGEDDVTIQLSEEQSSEYFELFHKKIIPSCQTAEVEIILQIKDGVSNITAEFNSESGDAEPVIRELTVPAE